MTVKFRQYFLIFIFGFLLSACQPTAKRNESSGSHQQAYTLHMGDKVFKIFQSIVLEMSIITQLVLALENFNFLLLT